MIGFEDMKDVKRNAMAQIYTISNEKSQSCFDESNFCLLKYQMIYFMLIMLLEKEYDQYFIFGTKWIGFGEILLGRVFANGPEDQGSAPGHVIPKA